MIMMQENWFAIQDTTVLIGYTCAICNCHICVCIYRIYKKEWLRFQKLTRNVFLTLHGHNVHRQQRQLSKFLMCYQQFASHAYCGDQFQRWRRSRKRLSVCSVLRCPDLWLQCSAEFCIRFRKDARMRNLDSCRCWRCTLCPGKVRNKFLLNF